MKLAEIFADHMTLQCGKPVRIWGESEKAQEITVSIDGEEVLSAEVAKGAFELYLPAQPAEESVKLAVGDVVVSDVDFGEVFIAGGQSNMEFLLRYDMDYRNGEAIEKDEHLRFYDVGEYAFEGEKEEGFKDGLPWDRWLCVDPDRRDELDYFSAVGFYFARQLRKAYGRPVAIVGCNWGGSTASTWVPKDSLTGALAVYQQEYDAAVQTYPVEEYLTYEKLSRQGTYTPQGLEAQDAMMYGVAEWAEYCKKMAEAPAPEGYGDPAEMQKLQEKMMFYMSVTGPHDKNRPGALYETMLLKIAGFSARGVLWYQGESDENHAELYGELFTLLIHEWRELWKEELPFIFVQLAPFESWLACLGTNYPKVRAQQQYVEETVSQAYMVSISDIGERLDIHPKQKKPVGERMALKARHYIFGEDIACEYPAPASLTLYDGEIALDFEGCAELVIGQMKEEAAAAAIRNLIELFEITADGAPASVTGLRAEGTRLFLSCEGVSENTEEIEVRFAQKPYYVVNLYNEIGIPAAPFVI